MPLEQERERHVAWRTPHPLSSPRRPPEPWRRARDELKPAIPLPGAPNVVVWQTTAGWRSAPASAQRVSTRGLARISSISPKNTMNTAGLEWFGPPERNTLHPLCVVLSCLERVCESLVLSPACVCVCSRELSLYSERLPFISQGRRVHGRWVPDRWAQQCRTR